MPSLATIIGQIERKMSVTEDTNPRKKILVHVLMQLLATKNELDAESLKKILQDLGRVNFHTPTGLFSKPTPKMLAAIICQETGQTTPPQYQDSRNSFTPEDQPADKPFILSANDKEFFFDLYRSISELYNRKTYWAYQYPTDKENNEVMNEAIHDWRQLMYLPPTAGFAYRDFKRDYKILGQRTETDAAIDAQIAALVNLTPYPDDIKKAFRDWIATNGGQDNNRCIDLLLQYGEFSRETGYAVGQSKLLDANWDIKNAKPCLSLSIQYYSVILDGEKCLALVLDKESHETQPKIITAVEAADLFANKELAPMLQASIDIALDVGKEKIIPRITHLFMTSYTDALSSPELKAKRFSPTK